MACCAFIKIEILKPSFHHRRQVVFPPKSNRWIPVLHGIASSIFQQDSRTTEVDELLFHVRF